MAPAAERSCLFLEQATTKQAAKPSTYLHQLGLCSALQLFRNHPALAGLRSSSSVPGDRLAAGGQCPCVPWLPLAARGVLLCPSLHCHLAGLGMEQLLS